MLQLWASQSEEVPDLRLPMGPFCHSCRLSMDYLLDAFNARSGDIYSRSSHRIPLSQHRLWHTH